ncbi:hypothetical protein [Granulicella tundricola]|uniref:hypothetical protein n=1 Tax=Granulicella tundricola TaxID=940615 RepID=UPI0012FC5753|nr:hypothetical protein [Granulicella tundricola]
MRVLAEHGIPSLVVGGYAVQEHGYARFTSDVDIVVPDVAAAMERLSISGFRVNPGSSMTLTDRVSKVEIDLLPGDGAVGPGPLMLPLPAVVSEEPTIATLRTLIEIKLSSYLGSPVSRLRDLADVIELIKANDLDESFALHEAVAGKFIEVLRDMRAEGNRSK